MNELDSKLCSYWASVFPSIDSYIKKQIPLSDVEDVTGEVLFVVIKKFKSFLQQNNCLETELENFLKWTFRITTFEILKYRKKHRLDHKSVYVSEQLENIPAEKNEIVAAVEKIAFQQILINLNEKEIELIRMKIIDDLKFNDISQITGEKASTLMTRYDRLKKKLLKLLKEF